ncbi:MAG: hypothetical protein AAF587_03545 [Bacteroidota bacterium]
MNIIGIIFLIVLLGAGGYFAVWAMKKTLADDTDKNRRQRRGAKR